MQKKLSTYKKNKLKKIFNKDLKYIIKNLDIKKFTNEIEKSPDRFNKKYGAGDMFGSIRLCLRSEYPVDGFIDEFGDLYSKFKEFKLFINKLQFTGKLLPKLSNNFVLEEYFDFGTVSHSLISSKFKKNYLYVFCERREFYNESKSVYEKHDIIDNYVEEIFKKKFGRVQFSEYLMKRNKILHLSNSLTINKTPDFDDLDFDDLVENLELKKFIKFLDRQCKYKIKIQPVEYFFHKDSKGYKKLPYIVLDLVSSSTSKTMSYKKLLSGINKNSGDIIHLAIENGTLLPQASNNFKLEKSIDISFDDGQSEIEDHYDYQIISSKINKSYYILVYYVSQVILQEDIYFCKKKFKNKNLAIKFVKEEHKKLKKYHKIRGYSLV